MSILYNKTGELYGRTRDVNWVQADALIDSFPCKIEPVQDVSDVTFDWMSAFEVYQVFSDNMDIVASNYIVIEGDKYEVKGVKRYDGIRRKYTISFVNKSQWS